MSLRGVFTDLVTLTDRPLGRQIHGYRIAFPCCVRCHGKGVGAGFTFPSISQSSLQNARTQRKNINILMHERMF